jgi:hypothetical protein
VVGVLGVRSWRCRHCDVVHYQHHELSMARHRFGVVLSM